MHANNQKAIAHWTAEDYARAARDFINYWCTLKVWYSGFMPEDDADVVMEEFYKLCEKFHELGF